MRDAVKALTEKVYTAVNSLEVRLNEQISTRAYARIRKVLTQVKNAKGEWERFVLAAPPNPADHPGLLKGGSKAQACGNWDLGIFPNRPVLAPFPVHTAPAMRTAAQAMMGGRNHSLAIPSVDGFSGAGWDCLDVCADVWKGALHDKNLRSITGLRQNVRMHLEPSLRPLSASLSPHPSPQSRPQNARSPCPFRCASATSGRPLLVYGAFG